MFNNPKEVHANNQIFISLILKINHPELVTHFRPIGLCNAVYKLATKMIANRLKRIMPVIITPTQCSFIPRRNGSNNIIVAQEIIHKMQHATSNKGYMAIKLDLEKAYDRLAWLFVVDSLKKIGLSTHFINIIWHCIFSVSIDILWNGERMGDFIPTRAIDKEILSLLISLLYVWRGFPI